MENSDVNSNQNMREAQPKFKKTPVKNKGAKVTDKNFKFPKTLDLSYLSNHKNNDTDFENYFGNNIQEQPSETSGGLILSKPSFKCSFCMESFVS